MSPNGSLSSQAGSFASASSIQGLRYAGPDSGLSPLARAAWLALVTASCLYGAVSIRGSFQQWSRFPLTTTQETLKKSVTEIAYPTVTICPEVPFDRWAAIRGVLDRVAYPCATGSECPAEAKMREHFGGFMHAAEEEFSNKIESKVAEGKVHLDLTVLRKVEALIRAETEMDPSFPEDFDSRLRRSLFSTTRKGVLADRGIPDIYDAVNSADPGSGSGNDDGNSTLRALALKASFYLAGVPPVEFIGSAFSHLVPQIVGRSFRESHVPSSDEVIEVMMGNYEFAPMELELLETFETIFGVENVSAFEIPAMMEESWVSPVYSSLQATDQTYEYTISKLNAGNPDWYDEPNHIGRMLSVNRETRLQVLAIMAAASIGEFNMPVDAIAQTEFPLDPRKEVPLKPKHENFVAYATFCHTNCMGLRTDPVQVVFDPVITARGICYAFNAGKTLRETFTDPQPDLVEMLEPEARPGTLPVRPTDNGGRLTVFLDAQRTFKPPLSGKAFTLSLGDRYGLAGSWEKLTDVEVGYRYHVQVEPVEVTTDPDLRRGMTPEERKCRFEDEVEEGKGGSAFRKYAKSYCKYEYTFRKKMLEVGCMPWYYPLNSQGGDVLPLCDGFQLNRLSQMRLNGSSECDCAASCQMVHFSSVVNTMTFRSNECDQKQDDINRMTMDTLKTHLIRKDARAPWLPLARVYHQLTSETGYRVTLATPYGNLHQQSRGQFSYSTRHQRDVCRMMLQKDFSEIVIEFSMPVMTTMNMHRSASFGEKLAQIGGTLGLFTGLSLIGLVETCYWMVRIVTRALGSVVYKSGI